MRIFAGLLIVLACVFIALGRSLVRRAAKSATPGAARRQRRYFGWALVLLGGLLMIVGVVIW